MFSFKLGRDGQIFLFFCGIFLASCDNWQEVEYEQKQFLGSIKGSEGSK